MFGADCSSFIVYGKRRQGLKVPYLNPVQLLPYFHTLYGPVVIKNNVAFEKNKKVAINRQQIVEGLILHFRSHIAAVYQDKEPFNNLDGNDLIIHQLENAPEIIPFKRLKYYHKPFNVMKFE